MYVEKMRCERETASNDDRDRGGQGQDSKDNELVRVLVNDRVIPLPSCGADRLGRCRLDAFVESLAFATTGGLWDECFL
jgi:hypothetical protein